MTPAPKEETMMTAIPLQEFRNSGLLLLVNQFLHIFGIAIVLDGDDAGNFTRMYPARVKFRGFSADATEKAYINVSKYMQANADTLLKEAES